MPPLNVLCFYKRPITPSYTDLIHVLSTFILYYWKLLLWLTRIYFIHRRKAFYFILIWMYVMSCCSAIFVFWFFLYINPFCHGAFKLDLSTFFALFFYEHLFNLYLTEDKQAYSETATSSHMYRAWSLGCNCVFPSLFYLSLVLASQSRRVVQLSLQVGHTSLELSAAGLQLARRRARLADLWFKFLVTLKHGLIFTFILNQTRPEVGPWNISKNIVYTAKWSS